MKTKEGPGCRVFVEEVPFTRVHCPLAVVASAPSQQAALTGGDEAAARGHLVRRAELLERAAAQEEEVRAQETRWARGELTTPVHITP